MRTAIFWVAALAAASVTATPWGSRASQKCASYCKESNKFAYEPGTVYVYDYAAETATLISGTSDEEARLHVSAKAELEAISQCELTLRLRNVALEESDPQDASKRSLAAGSDRFAAALERHPLLFAFQDGVVEHMCPSVDEDVWVLNIKRGVLSAFQNSMENLASAQQVHEIDVTGHCEASYTVVDQGRYGVTVKKTKNLLSCTGRNSHVSAIQSTPYTSTSLVQSLPLMKCDNECEQVVSDKRLQKSTCTEVHMFQPFSNGDSGALTKVSQSLVYNGQKSSSEPPTDFKRTRASLLFVNEEERRSLAGRENVAIQVLTQLTTASNAEITSDVPKLFSSLVAALKPLSYNQLSKIFYNTKDARSKKFLTDAAPLVGTSASMGLMRDLIRDGVISETETDMWLASLAFQPKPTIDMIIAVAPLISEQPRQKALLGVSAMINTYCRSNSKCSEDSDVLKIVSDIEKILGNGCRSVDFKQEENILVALKALGNAGVVKNIETLKRCYEENNPVVIRIAAIDAIRRIPCDSMDRSYLMTFFRTMDQDPELRIAAYLAIMKCPTPELLEEIKQALISEAVNQVGSFIWTHLTNLQETSSPSKQQIRQMLSSEFLKNKFNTDVRKFSRNFEASTFFEELNIGGTVESNIIFSSKSYLPRSAMLNFTIDLFGESINLLEIGTRVEGFESLVESFFGPNGLVPEENLQKALQSIRGKREVDANALNQLSSIYNANSQITEQPEGNFYLRIFGNELYTKSFKGLSVQKEDSPLLMLLKNAGKDNEFAKSFMFVDTSYNVPTIVGLPLSLSVNGTASLSLRFGGKFEVNSVSSVNVQGYFKPSAATQVNGVMSVDAFVARSGVQVQSTMHSSTGLEGKVVVKGKDVVSLQLNMPQEKIEVFSRQSNIFLLRKGTQQPVQPKQTKVISKTCSADNLATLWGIEFCGEFEYSPSSDTAPRRPLNGPSRADIFIRKTDSHTGYVFDYKFSNEQIKRQNVRSLSLVMDTPNSRVNRRIAAQLVLDEPSKSVRVLLQSPLNSLDFNSKYEFNDMVKSADVVLNIEKNEYAVVRLALRSDVKGNTGRYEPSLLVSRKGRELVNIQGFYSYVLGSKHSFDLQVKQLTARPIRITGDVNSDGTKHDMNVGIKSYFLDASVNGNLRVSEKIFSSKWKTDYSFFEATTQQLEVSAKYSKTVKGALNKIVSSAVLQTSQYPHLNTDLSWELQTSTNYVENNGRMVIGKTRWDIQQLYSNQGVRGQRDLTLRAGVSCPKKNIDLLASYSQQTTDNSLATSVMVRAAPGKEWNGQLELSHKSSPATYSGRLEVSSPTSSFYARSEVVESQTNQWDALAAFKINKQEETTFTASFKNLSTAVKIQYATEFKARGPAVQSFDASCELIASVGQTSLTFAGHYGNQKTSAVIEYNIVGSDEHRLEARLNKDDAPVFNAFVVLGLGSEKSLSFDIKSGRHITFDAKVNPDSSVPSASLEIYWDKERNLNKAISFNGRLKGGSGNAVLKYPGRTITTKVTFKGSSLYADIEWESDQKIVVSMDLTLNKKESKVAGLLTTPFAGYERFEFATSHLSGKEDIKTQVVVTWRNERISITTMGKNTSERLGGSISVGSTFVGFENVSFEVNTVQSATETKFAAALIENGNKFETIARCARSEGYFTAAEMAVSTPIDGLESFKFVVNREISSESVKVKALLSYPGKNTVSVTVLGKRDSRELSGYIGMESPFALLRKAGSTFQYETTEKSKKLIVSGELNEQKVSLESSVVLGTRNTAEVSLTLPFADKISCTLTHSFNGKELDSSAKVVFAQNIAVAANVAGRIASWKDLDILTSIKSSNYENGLRLFSKLEDNKLVAAIETETNGKAVALNLSADLQGDSSSRQVRSEVSFTAPFLKELRATLEYNRNSKNFLTVFRIAKDGSNFELQHNLKRQDVFNWENLLELTSPYDGLKLLRLTSRQSLSESGLQHETTGLVDEKQFAITFSSNIGSQENKQNFTANGSVTSDWTEPISFEVKHEDDGVEFHPIVTLSASNYQPLYVETSYIRSKGSLSFNLEARSALTKPLNIQATYSTKGSSKKSSASLSWDSATQIKFDADLTYNGNSGQSKISLSTPGLGFEKTNIDASFDLTGSQKTGAAALSYGNKTVKLSTTAGVEGALYQAQVSLETPLKSYETLAASANLDIASKKGKVVLKRDRIEMVIEGGVALSATKVSVTAGLTSPVQGLESITVDGHYDASGNSKALRAGVDVNGEKTSFDASYINGKNQGSLSADLVTPVKGLTANLKLGYDFNQAEKTVFLNVQKEKDSIKFQGQGVFESSTGKFSANFEVPVLNLQKLAVSGSYASDAHGKSGQISLQANDKKVEAEGSLFVDESKAELGLSSKTDIKGYETISLNGKYDISKPEKSATITVVKNSDRIEFSGNANVLNALKSEASFDLKTPFEYFATVRGAGKFDFRKADKTIELSASRNEANIKLILGGNISGLQGKLNGKLNTPLADLETVSGEISFNLERPQKTIGVLLENGNSKTFDVQVRASESKFEGKLVSPLQGYELVTVKGDYSLNVLRPQFSLACDIGKKKFELAGIGSFESNQKEASIDIRTPLFGWENLSASFVANYKDQEKTLITKMKKNEIYVNTELRGLFSLLDSAVKIAVQTSFNDWKSFSIQGSYDARDLITGNLSIEKNGRTSSFTGEALLKDDLAKITLKTPFEGYRNLGLSGKLTSTSHEKAAILNLQKDNTVSDFAFSLTFDAGSAAINIRTPYERFETVSAQIKYDPDSRTASILVNKNEQRVEISGSLSVTSVAGDVALRFTSSFEGLESLELKTKYSLSTKSKTASAAASRNGKAIEISLTFSKSRERVQIDGGLKTPFKGYEEVTATCEMDFARNSARIAVEKNGSRYEVSGSVSWGERSFAATLNSSFVGFETFAVKVQLGKQQLEITTSTPFKDYESVSFNGRYDLTSETKLGRMILTLGSKRYENELRAKLTKTSGDINLNAQVPLIDQTVRIALTYTNQPEGKTVLFSAENDASRFETGLKFSSLEQGASGMLYAQTPFAGYEELDISGSFDPVERSATFAVKRNGRLQLQLAGKLAGLSGNALVKFVLPELTASEVDTAFSYSVTSDLSGAEIFIKFQENELNLRGEHTEFRTGRVTLTSSLEAVSTASLEWDLVATPFVIQLNLNEQVFRATLERKTNSLQLGNIRATLSTPYFANQVLSCEWSARKKGQLSGKASYASGEESFDFQAEITYGANGTINLTSKTPVKGWEDIALNVDYSSKNEISSRIQLTINHEVTEASVTAKSTAPKSSVKASINGPYTGSLVSEAGYDFSTANKKANGFIEYNLKRIQVDLEVSMPSSRRASGRLSLLTPFSELNSAVLSGYLDLESERKEAQFALERDVERSEIRAVLETSPSRNSGFPTASSASIMFNCSCLGIDEWRIEGSYDTSDGLSATAVTTWGPEKSIRLSFELNNSSVSAKINTPFEEYQSVHFLTTFDFDGLEQKIQTTVSLGDKTASFSAFWTFKSPGVDFRIVLNTPFIDFENLELRGGFDATADYSALLIYSQGERTFELKGNVVTSDDSSRAKLTFSSPSLDEVSAIVEYDLSSPQKSLSVNLRRKSDKIVLTALGEMGAKLAGTLSIEAPFMETARLHVDAPIAGDDRSGYLTLEYGEKKIEAHSTVTYTKSGRKMRLTVTTPFPGFKKINFNVKTTQESFDVSMEYSRGKTVRLNGNYQMKSSVYKVSGGLQTPFGRFEDLAVDATFNVTSGFDGKVTFQWGEEQALNIFTAVHEKSMSINLQTPFEMLRNLKLHLQCQTDLGCTMGAEVEWNDYQTSLEGRYVSSAQNSQVTGRASWNRKSIGFQSLYSIEGDDINASLEISTPFEGFTKMGVNVQLRPTDSQSRATVVIETPFEAVPTITSTVDINVETNRNVLVSFSVSAADRTLAVRFLAKCDSTKKSASLQVDMPLSTQYRSFYLNGELDYKSLGNFNYVVSATLPRGLYETRGSVNTDARQLKVTGSVETPNVRKNISFGADYSINDDLKQGAITAYLWDNKVTSFYEKAGEKMKGGVSISLPDVNNKNIGFNIDATIRSLKQAEASLALHLDRRVHKIAGAYQLSAGKLMGNFELDTPVFPTKKIYTVSVKFDKSFLSNLVIEAKLLDSDSSEFFASLNTMKALKAEIRLSCPSTGLTSIVLEAGSTEGKLNVQTAMTNHRAQYTLRNNDLFEFSAVAESPLLSDSVNIRALFRKTEKRSEGSFEVQHGRELHSVSGECNHLDDAVTSSLKIDSSLIPGQSASLEATLSDNIKKGVSGKLSVFGKTHFLSVSVEKLPKFVVEAQIESSFIPWSSVSFNAQAQASNTNVELEAAFTYGEKSVRLAGNAVYAVGENLFGSITCTTPFEGFSSARAKLNVDITKGLNSAFELQTSLPAFRRFEITAKYQLTEDVLEASSSISLPLKNWENLGLNFVIPVSKNGNEFSAVLSTPNGQHSVSVRFTLNDNKVELRAEGQILGKQASAFLGLMAEDVYQAKVELRTPFRGFETLSWDIKGQADTKKWGEALVFLELNGKRIEFTTNIKTEARAHVAVFQLTTPFVTYDRLALNLRFEGTKRKTLHVEFEYPGSRLGVEFDYVFNSFLDFICKTTVNTPFKGYERFSTEVSNRLSDNSYSGSAEARFAKYAFALNIDATLRGSTAELNVETRYNENVASLKMTGSLGSDAVDGSLTLNTPFEILQNIDSYVHIEKDIAAKNSALGLSVNGDKILLVSLSTQDGSRVIEIQNPIRPVALSYSFQREDALTNIELQLCWNVNRRTESSFGGQVLIMNLPGTKQISFKTLMPGRSFNIEFASGLAAKKLDHTISISWAEGKRVGYKILLEDASSRQKGQLDAILRFDFPSRSFEFESHHTTEGSDTTTSVEFKWDAMNDKSKRMGARLETSDLSSWTKDHRKAALILIHTALEQDIVLQGEYSKDNAGFINGKMELTYSPFEDQKFVAETSFACKEDFVFSFTATHPDSRLNIAINTEVIRSTETAGNVRIQIMDKNGQTRFFQVIGKLRPRVELALRTTEKSVAFVFSTQKTKNNYQVQSEVTVNDADKYSMNIQLGTDTPKGQLTLTGPSGSSFTVDAGLPTNREIFARATRDIMGKSITDGQFNIKLNTTEILSSRIYWRSASYVELKSAVSSFFLEATATADNVISELFVFASEEVSDKKENITPALRLLASNVANFQLSELKVIAADFSETIAYFREMYNSNEMYIQDLTEFAIRVSSAMHSHVKVIARNAIATYNFILGENSRLRQAVANTCGSVVSTVSTVLNRMPPTLTAMVKSLGNIYGDVVVQLVKQAASLKTSLEEAHKWVHAVSSQYVGRVEEVIMAEIERYREIAADAFRSYIRKYQPYIEKFTALQKTLRTHYESLKNSYNGLLEKAKQRLMQYEPVKRSFEFWAQYGSWLEEFHASDYIEIIAAHLERIAQDFNGRVNSAITPFKPYLNAVSQAVEGQMSNLKQIPIVAYMDKIAERALLQMNEFWKYVELEEKLRFAIRDILRHADKAAVQLTSDLQGSLDFTSPVFVFDPLNGKIELTLYLPVKWESLYETPKFIELPFFQKTQVAKKNFLDNIDMSPYYYTIMDTLATYRPILNFENVIPPFSSHAMIAGTQHYMTFDKKFYEFAGECSYLLVSDFVNNNFSAVVNYEGSNGKVTRKSITVLSNGRQIDIDSAFRITMNGKKVELPLTFENTAIKRDGHKVIVLNDNGFRVECNLRQDLCTVHVTGWSFGKTGGLFGVYNHESRDDFLTPFRQLRTDAEIDSFAHSWKVGTSRCRVRNYAVESQAPSMRNSRLCDELFADETSVLRPCFRKVDPSPFVKMCLNDLASLENSPKKDLGVCTAAAAYVTECRSVGIDLWVPSQCVRCELDNSNIMLAGDIKTYNGDAPRSADVVFVVDQKACLKNTRLNTLPSDIDAALKEKGINNNRFAVVGFGGSGIFNEPHIRTAEGQIWSNRKSIQSALEDMPLNGENKADILAALRYAASLQYRAGVSKQIILATCASECEADGYADALSLLLENDIRLHLLQPRDIMTKGKSGTEEFKNVFGFDSEQVYTVRSVRRLAGDRELRRQVVIPKDFCTPLAMETNGTLFDLNKMTRGDALLAKKFSDVFARRVALTAEPSECQRCDCVGDRDGAGSLICQRCVPPSLDKFIKDWEKLAYENELESEPLPDDYTVAVAEIKEKSVAKNPKKGNKRQ